MPQPVDASYQHYTGIPLDFAELTYMQEPPAMTTPLLPSVGIRAGLSLLAYHGVALIISIILLTNSIDLTATLFPMIATSQIGAATVWWTGAWLAPLLIDTSYQLQHWWLIATCGACQTLAVVVIGYLPLSRRTLSSLVQETVSLKVIALFILYGGVSSLVYLLLLRLFVNKKQSTNLP